MASFTQLMRDKAAVAKANLSGEQSDLEIAVAKATNHNPGPPKDKHVRRLISLSHQGSASVQSIVKSLTRRLEKADWVVTLKTLTVVHRLVREGDTSLIQCVRGHSGRLFRMSNFMDMTSPDAYEPSMFIRAYSAYLEERVCVSLDNPETRSSHSLSSDACRNMSNDKLFTVVPALQLEMDRLLDVPMSQTCDNETVLAAFSLLLSDLIPLFRALNEALITFLERYFHMQVDDATTFLSIFKRFDTATERVAATFDTARRLPRTEVSLPSSSISATKHDSLIAKLEEYLKELKAGVSPDDASAHVGGDRAIMAAASGESASPLPAGGLPRRASGGIRPPSTSASRLASEPAPDLLGNSPPPDSAIMGFAGAPARAPIAVSGDPFGLDSAFDAQPQHATPPMNTAPQPPQHATGPPAMRLVPGNADAFDLLTGSPGVGSPVQTPSAQAAGNGNGNGGNPFGLDAEFGAMSFDGSSAAKAQLVKSMSNEGLPQPPQWGGYTAQPQQPMQHATHLAPPQPFPANTWHSAPVSPAMPMQQPPQTQAAMPPQPAHGYAASNPFATHGLAPSRSATSVGGVSHGWSSTPETPVAGATGMRQWPSSKSVVSGGSTASRNRHKDANQQSFNDLVGMMMTGMPSGGAGNGTGASPQRVVSQRSDSRPMKDLL